jgi:GNAT superfamily N-acetyltransferase
MAITKSNNGLDVVLDAGRTFLHQTYDQLREALARHKVYPRTYGELAGLEGREHRDLGVSRSIVIHRLYAADHEDIRDHFLRLDDQSRRSRFCGAVKDSGLASYAQNIFRDDSIICGASVSGQLRGLVELRGACDAGPVATEVAFSVERDWQNMGIGDALFEHMFAIAQSRGVRTLQMMFLKENIGMQHLAVKHHAQLQYGSDAIDAVLYPHGPTPEPIALAS